MRILTLSNAPWDDRRSTGNTQSNWFSGWADTELFSMYTSKGKPDNKCCQCYYQVTIADIAKHVFLRNRIGRYFQQKDILAEVTPSTAGGIKVPTGKGLKNNFIQLIVELLYSSKIWLNRKLKGYVADFDPEIVFFFAFAEPFRYNLAQYLKKHTRAKFVMFVSDDVWGQMQNKSWLLRSVYRNRCRFLFCNADKIYGVSQMLCDEYSQLFNLPITPLYKGCDITPSKTEVGHPIQLVYAGNLFYGRDKTLEALANQLKETNEDGVKMQLLIYSSTIVSEEMQHKLNIEGTSKLCGVRPYDEIKKIMSNADIVLHVESFDPEQIKIVRLSLSTKIMDCMQSGAAMMVIGPKGIASVEYPRGIDGVFVVDELSGLKQAVNDIIEDPSKIISGAKKLNEYAKRNHEITAVRDKLQKDFQSVIFKRIPE